MVYRKLVALTVQKVLIEFFVININPQGSTSHRTLHII